MKKNYILVLYCMLATSLGGQGLFQTQEFVINSYAVSPSNTGLNSDHEIFAGFTSRFTGIQGSPLGAWANYNGNIKGNSGLGLALQYEKFGAFANVRADVSYAYHLLILKDHRISLGLNFSLNQTELDFSNSNSDPINDPALQNAGNKSGLAFNAGAGVTYCWKALMVAVAMPFIVNNKRGDAYTLYSQSASMRYFVAYDIVINKTWDIRPMAEVNQVFKSPVNYVATVSTRYRQIIWLNLGYSAQNMLSVGLGAVIADRVTFQYTYEYSTEGIVRASSGNHELVLGVLLANRKNVKSANSVFKTSRQNPYYEWQ